MGWCERLSSLLSSILSSLLNSLSLSLSLSLSSLLNSLSLSLLNSLFSLSHFFFFLKRKPLMMMLRWAKGVARLPRARAVAVSLRGVSRYQSTPEPAKLGWVPVVLSDRSSDAASLGVHVTGALAPQALLEEASAKSEGDKDSGSNGFRDRTISEYEDRIRYYSEPNKVFRYFATVEIDGVVYMRPEDFVRAVTPGQRQPTELGLDIFEKKGSHFGSVTSSSVKRPLFAHNDQGERNMSHSITPIISHLISSPSPLTRSYRAGELNRDKDAGLISYEEFLFLLTALSSPPRQFELAFKMFDLDGNGVVDLVEFAQVQQAVQAKHPVGKRLPMTDCGLVNADVLQRSPMLQRFFGSRGNKKLTFEAFRQFMDEVQEDILRLDFIRSNAGATDALVMSQARFARLLLRYTRMRNNEVAAHVSRLDPEDKTPIKYEQAHKFFKCMRRVDDLELALALYHASGSGVGPEELTKAIRVATEIELDASFVKFLFDLFDQDGDGQLSEVEFIKVMKDARSRGLNKTKNLPVDRLSVGFSALLTCLKQQVAAGMSELRQASS
ncbi:uncharacterized protein MONBRDRAFT_32612 [Monosiga brevicollis MX1]|uniref:EF-hand domain-containing protein n=1 Tax=Monosiga brevicollis TaxID=81824 RepID=A9V0P9_MONBE|nr:uncharacterized protein MONBRDRAFT_32612 [Monosiga brevicollis MX1]EDQ88675.1 predicted protein [Monosiga brevicollis MX1]|eukprot:XP_001746288.1 hypothetical protein [Monosiga brevicollis MX1]